MMAAFSLPSCIGPNRLPRASHGTAFVALLRAPRHRSAGPRPSPLKLGANDIFAPFGTHLPGLQTAILSLDVVGSPFNAHSSSVVQAA